MNTGQGTEIKLGGKFLKKKGYINRKTGKRKPSRLRTKKGEKEMDAREVESNNREKQTQVTRTGLPSDTIKIVPPKDEGWLVIKGKQETVVIGSGEDMVVVTFKSGTTCSVYVKTTVSKPICRLRHFTMEKQKALDPYIPEKIRKNKSLLIKG